MKHLMSCGMNEVRIKLRIKMKTKVKEGELAGKKTEQKVKAINN